LAVQGVAHPVAPAGRSPYTDEIRSELADVRNILGGNGTGQAAQEPCPAALGHEIPQLAVAQVSEQRSVTFHGGVQEATVCARFGGD